MNANIMAYAANPVKPQIPTVSKRRVVRHDTPTKGNRLGPTSIYVSGMIARLEFRFRLKSQLSYYINH